MCLQPSRIQPYQRWRWAGDEIVADAIVPARRKIPGTPKAGYDVDIREFLSIEDDAVVHKHLEAAISRLPVAEQVLFRSRCPGAFDFRARTILRYLSRILSYRRARFRAPDEWLFPAETLSLREGDCEDLAFVLVAMLEAAGISSYCLRVALGSVVFQGGGRARRSHHAWAVYFNEQGAWQVLEPLRVARRGVRRPAKGTTTEIEYVPHFVFNRDHLWRVRSRDAEAARPLRRYLRDREFWRGFDPSFALGVHEEIFDSLRDEGITDHELRAIKSASFRVDVNVLGYDPRDHFDFAYVERGWRRVQERLTTGRLVDLGLALHAIGDFYAHTTYADFAIRDGNALRLYDPAAPSFAVEPSYDFAPYAHLPGCGGSLEGVAARWKGAVISGQWWRWFTSYPDDLQSKAELALRRCLPDHDQIAVDGGERAAEHLRYSPPQYRLQYELRRGAAIAHVKHAWRAWRARHGA